MAVTDEGRRLTERHRATQLGIRAALLREVLTLWPALDPLRLADTAPAWLRAMLALIIRYRATSASEAQSYYRRFRDVEADSTGVLPSVSLDWARQDRAAQVSLTLTGPASIRHRLAQGIPVERASKLALVQVSGVASRHMLAGGRRTILETVAVDRTALGWARVTDADPCAFCALLASRGPAYRSQGTATFQAHDGCGCTAEPVFDAGAPWPGRAREFEQIYRASTADAYGKEKLRAFRRAYEGR